MSSGGGVQRRLRTRLVAQSGACICVMAAALLAAAPSAAAAPDCLQSTHERYEPGEEVTVVGYGCVPEPSGPGAGESSAVVGYLHPMPDPCADVDPNATCNPEWIFSKGGPPVDPASGVPLGRLSLEESHHPLRRLRASLTFQVPSDIVPGAYIVLPCEDPCGGDAAYPTWPSPLHVGVDPPAGERRVHHWPLDDPAIDLLPGDALLLGPDGDEVTAADLRAVAADDADRSVRVETAAAPDDEPRGGPTRLVVWLVAAALLFPAGWVVSRLGARRQRIRPGP